MEKNNILITAMVMALKTVDNKVLATANITLSWQDCLPPGNNALKAMKEVNLVDETGRPADKESLMDALSIEINNRIDSGKW